MKKYEKTFLNKLFDFLLNFLYIYWITKDDPLYHTLDIFLLQFFNTLLICISIILDISNII